jgi:excinuclease ABC subunit C
MKRQYANKKKLPDAPGVYIFRDYRKRPLYIGRATSLKDRLKSYFSDDLIDTRGPRIVDMVTKAKTLTWQETSSVLEAVLLESALIKRYQPFYNVDEKDDKSSQYVIITNEPWPRVFLARARDFEQSRNEGDLPYAVLKCFGPFTESALIKEALKILRRLFPFRDKKALDLRHERFYQAIGRAPDQAPGQADSEARKSYMKTIHYLSLFFEGESRRVRSLIEAEMKRNAKALKFEEAGRNRKLLYALDHINDIALIKRNKANGGVSTRSFRIEAYDIAHLSGTSVVGAMTVSINGQLTPADYRKFKVSKEENNDAAGLAEILYRRLNHSEWDYPDLIVVDGNQIQKNAAESVLKARRVGIPVVAVTKDERHKAAEVIGLAELVDKYRREIIAVNAEAHRFAIKYHRLRRSIRQF